MTAYLQTLPPLARLPDPKALNVSRLRDGAEPILGALVWVFCGFVLLIAALIAYGEPVIAVVAIGVVMAVMVLGWIEWNLALALIRGHSIRISAAQYSNVFKAVKLAADALGVKVPEVYVLQGEGVFDLFVAKRYTRRGIIILTSNMMDAFAKEPTSREFMMLVGRQLGHMKAGHFRYWWIRDVVGPFSTLLYFCWKRHCHFTADRLGLLIAGDLAAAQRALARITVGEELAPTTNFDEIEAQREFVFSKLWSWIALGFSQYPFMIDRMCRLVEFAKNLEPERGVGALPIEYPMLRPLAILLIHGHDELALLEIKDFLRDNYPDMAVLVMKTENLGSRSMSEKFETVVKDASGAIAIMTPDDYVIGPQQAAPMTLRARQNVIIEIGWIWGRLGRDKVLLLGRGEIEIPSDLTGVEVVRFERRPSEKFEDIRKFLAHFGHASTLESAFFGSSEAQKRTIGLTENRVTGAE